MEKRGRKISSLNSLRVRGPAQFDADATLRGVPLAPLKLFCALVKVWGDGAPFFLQKYNNFGHNPTLSKTAAGVFTFIFAEHTFTNFTTAVVAPLDTHPDVTFDFVGSAWFRFRTLSGGTPADGLTSYVRVLIIDFA